jgi:hypothetical protein
MQKVAKNGTLLQQMAMWQQMALQLASRYEPETARMMAGNIMMGAPGGGGTMAPSEIANINLTDNPGESKITEKAKARSEAARTPA